jgi:hypothetical protein
MNNMKRKNSEIDDAFFQIKNLEEALNRNAEGILASTMREEISSLVKESLKEDEEEEITTDVTSTEDDEEDDTETTTDDSEELELMGDEEGDEDDSDDFGATDNSQTTIPDVGSDLGAEDETIDATPEGLNLNHQELITVFKSLGPNDQIEVKKDNNMLHLKDSEKDVEYLIQLGESEEDEWEMEEGRNMYSKFDDDDDDDFDEISLEELYDKESDLYDMFPDHLGGKHKKRKFGDEGEDEDDEFEDEESETIYEIALDDNEPELDEFDLNYKEGYDSDSDYDLDSVMESKKTFKAKGTGMGNPSKFKYSKRPNLDKGFNENMKEGPKTKFTGKAKFDYKEEVNSKGFGEKGAKKPTTKKVETKEASRFVKSIDRKVKRGLMVAPSQIKEGMENELVQLREKNEEYRKALNIFREKLNEVAVFNSNLAYATRLFTEHSTTKQEKINILRRFDNVETLKESKGLYKSIKDELSIGKEGETTTNLNESVERKVIKTPSSGSAINLIESKTYENPQFLRMKDLMTKIK